jgi:phage regulator Rha-like protein
MKKSTQAKKLPEIRLVEVHGQKLLTTSLAISEKCNVTHEATLKRVRKFLDDLNDVGRVRFQIRPFETKGGVQEQEIALLDDYAAMLLLTHMRSLTRGNEVVSKFKLALVKEFKRMRRLLAEPGRKESIKVKCTAAKDMTDMLEFVRESLGKETAAYHYTNEHRFCNRALTGIWQSIIEADLDVYDTRLLSAIRKRNTLLMTRYPKMSDRKKLLDDFVTAYRDKHPRLLLVVDNEHLAEPA